MNRVLFPVLILVAMTAAMLCAAETAAETVAEITAGSSTGSAAAGQAVTARVDGRPILLADIEAQLLRREGAEAVGEIAKAALAQIDWGNLPAGAVLTLPAGVIDREGLLKELLPRFRETNLDELIAIAVVRAACAAKDVVINEVMIAAEIERAENKLEQVMAARGLPRMDLDAFLREHEQTTLAEYKSRPAFRHLIVGLHALVRAEAVDEVGEAALQKQFDADPKRFAVDEAVDLSALYIPFRKQKNADGVAEVTPEERLRLGGVMGAIHAQLAAGSLSFGNAFTAYARSYDPDAAADGRIGWVRHDGTRTRENARIIPEVVCTAAFAAKGPFPQLLAPVEDPDGIEIILVHGWRPAAQPDFTTVRDRLVNELVDTNLEARSRALLARLRKQAPVTQRTDGTVVVNTDAITVQEVEDAVLLQHGAEAAKSQLLAKLDDTDWAALPADRPVLLGRGWSVEQPVLAARLLERSAAAVREDLIGIELLRGAVAQAGIHVDSGMIEREIGRLERAYRRSKEAKTSDFARFVHQAYGSSIADLRLDPAFRALAGCAEVMRRKTVIADAEAQAFFDQNRDAYRQDEGVDCSLIFLAHRAADGKSLTQADRERTRKAAGQMYGLLREPQADFARMWREFGRRSDPLAQDGHIGWVGRDGRRAHPQARVLPPEAVKAIFAQQGPFPVMLPPIENAQGVDLIRVEGRRAALPAEFARVADTVRRDCLEADWDQRLQTFVDDLRRQADIIYEDLPPLVKVRAEELGIGK